MNGTVSFINYCCNIIRTDGVSFNASASPSSAGSTTSSSNTKLSNSSKNLDEVASTAIEDFSFDNDGSSSGASQLDTEGE